MARQLSSIEQHIHDIYMYRIRLLSAKDVMYIGEGTKEVLLQLDCIDDTVLPWFEARDI